MTTEFRNDPRKSFVPRYLPWILAAVMLAVYWLTLERWVSVLNLDYVARLSGWTWQPEIFGPLTYLVTYPFRWLPTADLPVALNTFSAVCAALSLGLLARSVTLLPQDRTEAQRLRETSDFAFLTTRMAWLPPVLAVLVCGLQFTFWENATNFTGESLDLLAFAFMVWTLVEYRLDEREGRLMLAMFIYGADMTQNVGLIGFLPLLAGALIWIRGLSFFNSRFLTRLIFCGLAGTSLYLLLPTLGVISGKIPGNLWWTALRINLSSEWAVLKLFFTVTDFRHDLALMSLTTVLPVVLLAFRWNAGFGDRSRLGTELTGFLVHAVFAVILVMCLWGAFDPPFSARHLGADAPGLSFLTLYYLAALSTGYFSGYFLLVTKTVILKNAWRKPPSFLRLMNPAAITAVSALTLLAVSGLILKNGPLIHSLNNDVLKKYARQMEASLPPTGGIVLSDSEVSPGDNPRRLFLLQEALVQDGREKQYVPVDTFALNAPEYHRYLHKKYPDRWPLVVDAKSENMLDPHAILAFWVLMAQTNNLYYLHPSFGYYFERFYLEPHNLIYQLKKLPDDTLLPQLPDDRLAEENNAFWTQAEAGIFNPIIQEVAPVDPFETPRDPVQKFMKKRLHVQPEPNYNAELAGLYYSRSLDFWGVTAQRRNDLKAAAEAFGTAQKLNPDNGVAQINLAFNQDLQAGRPATVDLSKTSADEMGKYRSWNEMVTANGPFDEPSFCYSEGQNFLQSSYLNEALASFTRVHQLVPDHLPTLLALGEIYVFTHRPDQALNVLQEPMSHPDKFSLDDGNSMDLNVIAAAAYYQQTNFLRGTSLMEKEIAHHPDNNELLTSAAQVYMTQGLLTNALHVIKLKLQLTPGDPAWLFNLGYTEMRLNHYDEAIGALTQVLAQQPNNADARFNRAVAFLNTGKFNAASSDYQQLKKISPNSYQVAYGLGEIAWRQHDTNAAIENYTVYLANAATNTAEAKMISQRLAELQGKSP